METQQKDNVTERFLAKRPRTQLVEGSVLGDQANSARFSAGRSHLEQARQEMPGARINVKLGFEFEEKV